MVSRLSKVSVLTLALFSLISVQAAVKIVECEDEEGNKTFQKVCPTGSTMVSEKNIRTGGSSNEGRSKTNIEATLYLIPECEACDEAREFLKDRKISITEKNVNENIELQTELTELTGALKVPTTVIGEEVLTGYSRTKFLSVIEAAGYKDGDS